MAEPLDIRKLLAEVPQLAGVSADVLTTIAAASATRLLAPGEALLHEGATAEHLFVVRCGLLAATVAEPDGAPRPVAWFSRGDLVGEMALFTGKARTASVTARRHALVLAIPLDVGRHHLLSCPEVLAALSELMLVRTRDPERPARPGPALVAGLALGGGNLARRARALLAGAVQQRPGITAVTAEAALSALGPGALEAECTAELARWLHDAEGPGGLTVLDATEGTPAWAAVAGARADRVLVFVEDASDPEIRVALKGLAAAHGPRVEAVLLSEPDQPLPEFELRVHIVTGPAGLVHLLDVLSQELVDLTYLRRFPLFADSSDDTLALVRDAIRWRRVRRGATLLREGDDAGAVYLIHAGRFRVVQEQEDGERDLRDLGPGDSIGELSALTSGPRSASVFAIRDSIVAWLPLPELQRLLTLRPSLGLGLARVVAARAAEPSLMDRHRPPRNIAVLPLAGSARSAAFARELVDTLRALEVRVSLLDAVGVDAAWGPGASGMRPGQPGEAALMAFLHRLEADHDVVVHASDGAPGPWTERCLHQADRVLLVAEAGISPELRPVERALFAADPRSAPSMHLALLQAAGIREAAGTAPWLELRPGVVHHHVRAGDAGDRGRLARRLIDRAVGLALAGASSRGYAHYGVIRGVVSRGLPIDLIAGSSSGAAVAATYTTGMDWATAIENSLQAPKDVGMRPSRLQPPLASLMSGAAASANCRRVFGDRRIEDMLIPGIYTAVDLNRHELVLLRTGPLWLAVRASTSLPMFWPPVWWGERLLVDGGLISYVPVEAVMEECASGLAIASDLDPESGEAKLPFEGHRRYGDHLSGWRLLAERLNPLSTPEPYPTLSQVLFHTMCMKSFEQGERLRRSPRYRDVRFVRPRLVADGFFTLDRAAALAYERLTFEATREALADLSVPVLPDEHPKAPRPLVS